MKLFAASIVAHLYKVTADDIPRLDCHHNCIVLKAESKSEAEDIALRYCQKSYPQAAGFFRHGVCVMEIGADAMLKAVE